MNRIILFLLGKLTGRYPICDRCLDVDKKQTSLSFLEYLKFSTRGSVYCEPCWNFIHLRKGTCSCGNKYSNRGRYGLKLKTCDSCYSIVKMEVA